MRTLPAGTVTFVLTDIEGSTGHFHRLGDAYAAERAHHNRILRGAIEATGGLVVEVEGDSFFAAFGDAHAAVLACVDAQRALGAFAWSEAIPLRVRMGVHTAPAEPVDGGYVSLAVHQAARVMGAGHGDQIVVSPTTAAEAQDQAWQFERLGEYRLRGFPEATLLYQVSAPGLRAEFPPLRAPGVVNHNLPALLFPLVGRDDELAALRGLLARERLVTLVGPGGVGKTSLAILAAEGSAPRFPGGAWWVDLAGVKQTDLVSEAIGDALGVLEGGAALEDRIEERLIAQPTLLVLDNCEHLVAPVTAILSRLIGRCPDLTIAATSREALGQRRETIFEVTTLGAEDAVSLLVERAGRAGWESPVGATDADNALTEIARYLDGLPLALELVGARLGERSAAQVLDELQRAETRVESPLLAPAMRASLAWSYDLLDDVTAACFRRLSVFAGAGTLEAAIFVCGADGQVPGRVAELLLDLSDRSLVEIRRTAGRRRVHMLQPIRAFATELLAGDRDEAAVDRHLAWYLELASGAPGVLDRGPARRPEGERLSADVEDLRAALGHAATRGDGHAVLTIGRVAAGVCSVLSRLAEAKMCHTETIAAAPELHPDRARAAADLAGLLYVEGKYDEAELWATEASHLAAASGAVHAEALALTNLARLAALGNDLDRADSILERALAVAKAVGGHPLITAFLAQGLFAERRGDFHRQVEANEQALALARQLEDPRDLTLALSNLATARMNLEDVDASEALLREAVDLSDEDETSFTRIYAYSNLGYLEFRRGNLAEARRLGDRVVEESRRAGRLHELAHALNNVAEVALAAGDHEAAWRDYSEAVRLGQKLGEAERMSYCLEGLAGVAVAQGNCRRGVQLLAFADDYRRTAQVSLPDAYRESNESVLVDARADLGPDDFADAWRSGRQLDLEGAINLATGRR